MHKTYKSRDALRRHERTVHQIYRMYLHTLLLELSLLSTEEITGRGDDAQKAAQSTLEVLEDPCPQDIDDYIPDEYYFDEENQDYAGEGSSTSAIVKKRKSAKNAKRMKWTETEEKEIRVACLFFTANKLILMGKEDKRDEFTSTLSKAWSFHRNWKSHIVRARNQDCAKSKILDNFGQNDILIVLDWAILAPKIQERSEQLVCKRGISWHISVSLIKEQN
ncbi:unnamed protein product [Mytilus edulis]|uniref:Uncharacterized protein n=1 Tax=Mytilus edulis TaxID=6550 RepID=A0A8S3STA6_MYTED|nr:unnamed protein product [Mytilus edulis]